MSWTAHNTVAAVIEKNGRFLMVEEMSETGDKVFNQPAGHLNEGESLIEAAIRETREETAWGFIPGGLVGIYRWQVPPGGRTYIRFCFHGDCTDHHPDQSLDPDILGTRWMTRDELASQRRRLRSPMVLACIDDYLAGLSHSLSVLNDLG